MKALAINPIRERLDGHFRNAGRFFQGYHPNQFCARGAPKRAVGSDLFCPGLLANGPQSFRCFVV
jgi:hypothetical protein